MNLKDQWSETRHYVNGTVYTFRMFESITGVINMVVDDGNTATSHVIGLTDPLRWHTDEEEVRDELLYRHEKYLISTAEYQHAGPTNQELAEHVSLQQAWQEYQIVRRLLGL